jgi:hypothetical protein
MENVNWNDKKTDEDIMTLISEGIILSLIIKGKKNWYDTLLEGVVC